MKRIAFLLLGIYCFTACNNEIVEIIPEDNMQIKLVLPEPEMVNVYSTATVSENTISNLWVLMFNGNTLENYEFINVTKIVTSNTGAAQLLPQLSFKPADGRTIVCIANSDIYTTSLLPANPLTAITLSNINTVFKLENNPYYIGGEHLPMYGSFTWNIVSGYICEMTRAVAKVQVRMGEAISDVTGNFTPNNVFYRIHRAGLAGSIQPAAGGVVSGTPQPSGAGKFTDAHYLLQNTSQFMPTLSPPFPGADFKTAYLYEYPSSNRTGYNITTDIGRKNFHVDRQHIIIGKVNAPADTTYYRLDFYNPKDSTFYDTKRNHFYLFTINKVRSEGYRTLAQAQNNPGSNIEYTVRVNDESTDIISNGQYAIVANLDTVISGWVSTGPAFSAIGSARYQLPLEMSSLPPGTLNTISVTPSTSFSISPPPSSLTSSNQTIYIQVATGTADGTIGVITFQVGNIIYNKTFKFKRIYS